MTIADLTALGYRIYRDPLDNRWRWDRLQGPQAEWLTSRPFREELDAIADLRRHVEDAG